MKTNKTCVTIKKTERNIKPLQQKTKMTNSTFVIDDQTNSLSVGYGTPSTSGESFPVIMASNYEPKIKDEVPLCLLTDKTNDMSEDELASLKLTPSVVQYGDNDDCHILTGLNHENRFVILAKPNLYVMDKAKKVLGFLEKGMKLGEIVTVAKLYLAVLKSDDSLVMDQSLTQPQIFTLKLNSTKTKLILDNRNPKAKTIDSLNRALRSHYKTTNNLVHLVSVAIVATPTKFTSSADAKKSSVGIMFALHGDAKPLSDANQKMMSELVQSDRFIELNANPFGLLGAKEPVDDSDETESEDKSSDLPF